MIDDYTVNTRHCLAIDGHMIDMVTISTAELVEELSKRDGTFIEDLINPYDIYPWYVIKHEFKEYHRVAGPAKILVMRE